MFDIDARRAIEKVAKQRGWEAAALLAIAEVESAGKVFAIIAGRQEPLIRFEGHYFDKRLSGAKLKRARDEGLANPKAGAVANPKTQAGRWVMLGKARAIDAKAANESVSWGLGQVMGAHWAWLGYGSVDELVQDARNGVFGQVRLMANYIDKAGLAASLKAHDWEVFARGYNGPGFRKWNYHTKLAAAYVRWRKAAPLSGETKPAEKPVERQEPVPTRQNTGQTVPARPALLPARRKRIWTALLSLFGLSGGAALTQAETDAAAATALMAVLAVIAIVAFIIWWRGRK